MIDFVKIWCYEFDYDFIDEIKDLDFELTVNKKSGEVGYYNTAKYKNMTINLGVGRLEIKGSLHYLSNNGEHNANFLTYEALIIAIGEICELLQIDAFNCELKNLEFGHNIAVDVNPKTILNRLIMHHSGKASKLFVLAHDSEGKYKQAEHDRYILKAYDKSLTYRNANNIFRFEEKYMKSIQFKRLGITSLADLLRIENLERLQTDLLHRWNECIMYEPPRSANDAKKKYPSYTKWSESNFWNESRLKRNKLTRDKRKYQKFVKECTDHLHCSIAESIQQNWCIFTNDAHSTVKILNDAYSPFSYTVNMQQQYPLNRIDSYILEKDYNS